METLPDQDTVVKLSLCPKCGGIIRCAIKHMLTTKTKNEFMKEAMEYNLAIKELPLLEYRESGMEFCSCNG